MTRSLLSRRRCAALAAGALGVPLALAAAGASPAHADDANTITVVGTSDVSDSGLMANVIKPGFEAYEKSLGKTVTLNYVPKGTGAAITYAESGTASALIVHAASLENQFVAGGYSLEPAGRAMAWGDYVLLGPSGSDPAGVMSGGTTPSHDIVSAFQKIAAAGTAGTADFVSRGGTPGTTVQEHKIWSLTTGVPTCQVSDANGGGTVPSSSAVGAPCPTSPTNPDWYHTTGLTQGPNVTNADACNYNHGADCYVLTDKGTYEYLRSQDGGGAVSGLRIVAEDNDVAGQENLLINSFHIYGINPAAFSGNSNVAINTDAAKDLLAWTTSAAGQKAIGGYLSTDSLGAPFRPSASPTVTASTTATTTKIGQPVTIFGSALNPVPGTPRLANLPVSLRARPADQPDAAPAVVATTRTGDDGSYTFKYAPRADAVYTVTTAATEQTEDKTLTPPFQDLLQPGSATLGEIDVHGAITKFTAADRAHTAGHDVLVTGTLSPATTAGAQLQLIGKRPANKNFQVLSTTGLPAGKGSFSRSFTLKKGVWQIKVAYVHKGTILSATTAIKKVTIS